MVRGRGRAMQARFEIPLDPSAAAAVHAALVPEAEEGPAGSRIRLDLDEATLVVDIEADDLSALRAAMHSMLRLLEAARQTLEPGHKNA